MDQSILLMNLMTPSALTTNYLERLNLWRSLRVWVDLQLILTSRRAWISPTLSVWILPWQWTRMWPDQWALARTLLPLSCSHFAPKLFDRATRKTKTPSFLLEAWKRSHSSLKPLNVTRPFLWLNVKSRQVLCWMMTPSRLMLCRQTKCGLQLYEQAECGQSTCCLTSWKWWGWLGSRLELQKHWGQTTTVLLRR